MLPFYFINALLLWLIVRFTGLLGADMEFKVKSLKPRAEQQKAETGPETKLVHQCMSLLC